MQKLFSTVQKIYTTNGAGATQTPAQVFS